MNNQNSIRTLLRNGQTLQSAKDVITSLIGVKNGRQTWLVIKKRIPEITQHIITAKERGGPVDYLTSKGYALLIADLKSRKTAGHDNLRSIRLDATQHTNKLLCDAIDESNGQEWLYLVINDGNNMAVANGKPRDHMTTEEMIDMQFLELQEQRSLKRHKANGNTAIKTVCANVVEAFIKMKKV